MNVSLTPRLEELVQAKLTTGLYTSASEVIREALRLLEQRDRLREIRIEELRNDLAVGLGQLDRGEATEYDDESLTSFADNVKSKGRKRMAKKKRPA